MKKTYEKNGKVFNVEDNKEVDLVCELLKCFPTMVDDEYYIVTTRGTGVMHLKNGKFFLLVGGDDIQIEM